jgi:hypothetical protein
MKVQDELAKDRIQLPLGFLIKNLGEEFYDADLTLRQRELFQNQNDQVTERIQIGYSMPSIRVNN